MVLKCSCNVLSVVCRTFTDILCLPRPLIYQTAARLHKTNDRLCNAVYVASLTVSKYTNTIFSPLFSGFNLF